MHRSSTVGVVIILVISLEAAQHAVKLIVVCVVVMFCCVRVFTNLLIFWRKKNRIAQILQIARECTVDLYIRQSDDDQTKCHVLSHLRVDQV